MMNISDDDIFLGPISKEESQFRQSKRSLCSRRTKCFRTAEYNLSSQDTLEYDCAGYNPLEETIEIEKTGTKCVEDTNIKTMDAPQQVSYLGSRRKTEDNLGHDLVTKENPDIFCSIAASPSRSVFEENPGIPDEIEINLSSLSLQNEACASKSCVLNKNLEESKILSISGQSYIPPTPNNSTLEGDKNTYKFGSPSGKHVQQTYSSKSRNSNSDCNNCSENKRKETLSFRRDVADTIAHTVKNARESELEYANSIDADLISPTPYNSAAQCDDCSNANETGHDSKHFLENDLEIVTIHCSDDTDCDTQFYDAVNGKENVSVSSRDDSSAAPRNQFQVPEMTEKQQDMLRQLWMSPRSECVDSGSGSPLMNALDLSTTNDKVIVHQTNAKSSLVTLDLSIDERIPVMSYMSHLTNQNVQRVDDLKSDVNSVAKNKCSPFKVQKTPMKVISHKIGVVNVASSVEKNKAHASSKKPTSIKTFSNIPVPQSDHTKTGKLDFKKPLLYHGITMYKSKASGLPQRLFPSPCVTRSKKWNVASPVAKYINEDPTQPLEKIVRSKEQKELPTRNQKCGIPSPPQAASLKANVPVAYYKLKHGKISNLENVDIQSAPQRTRLFPSPFTPKLIKHEGPGKKISGATSLQISQTKRNTSNSLDQTMNKSIIKTIVSQRTNTLFKPLD